MDTKFTSKYSDVEQGKCVKQYLEGSNKEELSQKWGVSIRTIERWIKIYKDVNYIDIRMSKRNKVISIHIQKEVMGILNRNAIMYGFNISIWNESMVISLLKQKYYIEITRYMSKLLLRDRKYFDNKDEEKAVDEIIELEERGYKLVILDFFRIGKIERSIVEPLVSENFNQKKLNVNLAIARADEKVYLEVIFTDRDILERASVFLKVRNVKNIKKENQERKNAIDSKANFIRKVIKNEKNKIAFISMEDEYLKRFNKKNSGCSFYITDENSHKQLVQDKYEQGKSIIQHMYDKNNQYRNFNSAIDIMEFIKDKMKKYKGKVAIKINGNENILK